MRWFSVSDWFLLNVVVCVLTTVWVTIYPEPEGFKNLMEASGNSNQNCLHQNFLKESDKFIFSSIEFSLNARIKQKWRGGNVMVFFLKIVCKIIWYMNFHKLAVLKVFVNFETMFWIDFFFTTDHWNNINPVW